MMNNPLVSIIVPCYNYASFLADAVNSVCGQTYKNWECIIVDDGSTDNTKHVAEQLVKQDPRVFYYYKLNGGLSSARNYGIELAKGNFIGFLDSDDLLDSKKLEIQLNCFQQNLHADIVYGKAMFFEKNNLEVLYENKLRNPVSELGKFSGKGNSAIDFLNKQNITVVSSPLIKREVFKGVGDFDVSFKSYEDWHFWIRCALAGYYFKYHENPPVCTYIRFGHESMMSDKRKLLLAGIQLRKYTMKRLPLRFRLYNYYRLLRSQIKLRLT